MDSTQAQERTPSAAADLAAKLSADGRELYYRAQRGNMGERGQAAVMANELVDRARHAFADGVIPPSDLARLLRAAAVIRNHAQLPELPPDPLVHELIAHSADHGLTAHNAMAHALLGTLSGSRGSVGEAIDAAANALASIERIDGISTERALASCAVASLLGHLGLPDLAAEVYRGVVDAYEVLGMPWHEAVAAADLVVAEVSDGLWLERVGRPESAVAKFAAAATVADRALERWAAHERAVEHDRRSDAPIGEEEELSADTMSAFAAARYFNDPSSAHEEALRTATEHLLLPSQFVAVVALARLLAADGREAEAIAVLAEPQRGMSWLRVPRSLRLALARGVSDSDTSYTEQLEAELWASREGIAKSLAVRLEHERLRRLESPLSVSAGIDPVTRLPDRSTLEAAVEAALAEAPAVLAVVDVDELIVVNRRGSHADGDAALRAIAVATRGAVRPQDVVIRLPQDEFAVVMPKITVDKACERLRAVVVAVTALPASRGHGVTVSIGVAALLPDEEVESALVRADDAVGRAKLSGGGDIVTARSPARHADALEGRR